MKAFKELLLKLALALCNQVLDTLKCDFPNHLFAQLIEAGGRQFWEEKLYYKHDEFVLKIILVLLQRKINKGLACCVEKLRFLL